MKTVGEARIWLKENLKVIYAEEELPGIMFLSMNFITGLSQTQLHAFPEKELTGNQIQMLLLTAKKLQTGMPVQYALGETDFFGLKFEVNPSVLIPRPETEELVAWVLEERKSLSGDERSGERKDERILDIGTGSGCISVAIKKKWAEAEVYGLDISAEALQTAKRNALLNGVEVKFLKQDILNFKPVKEALQYSIIVSNPPYITPAEQEEMHNNVLGFEPHTALFVPEKDPLIFYRAIAAYASFSLEKNGLLFFEINEKYGQETTELLRQKGFVNIELRKDFRGKDRMIKAEKMS
ncbi:peptide chain release factor N(5)-glutamine methyltransferase [Mucilaginibacter arboris]|uniref:peptide chain release factor N(5)-glutamine methyltransferase n=1 Tax=Mucilaginibacter arboris TaxID=2682090 RepID=A0A7K1SUX6_9SPHI|nr:peptide chain release factor N(5)-glutamine methyltransferase [Mucilaginibacter arboris]MVN20840.1 peptide chain release factor N(5)-glutamine methyltransferase [Mucilaginibacter arboris]